MTDHEARAVTVERAARAGADVAATSFRRELTVETKAHKTDVVTQADRNAQRRVIEVIQDEYPDDAIVGEEEDELKETPDEGAAWVIDPIDGTSNFVRGNRRWATSVAAVVDGEPVAAANVLPSLGDSYVAGPDGVRRNDDPASVSDRTDPEAFAVSPINWSGPDRRDEYVATARSIITRFGDLRRVGSAQATLSMVADGALEATLTVTEPNDWDVLAGAFMVETAGGTVTDLAGNDWRHDSDSLIASNGRSHATVLEAAREAVAAIEED